MNGGEALKSVVGTYLTKPINGMSPLCVSRHAFDHQHGCSVRRLSMGGTSAPPAAHSPRQAVAQRALVCGRFASGGALTRPLPPSPQSQSTRVACCASNV